MALYATMPSTFSPFACALLMTAWNFCLFAWPVELLELDADPPQLHGVELGERSGVRLELVIDAARDDAGRVPRERLRRHQRQGHQCERGLDERLGGLHDRS
jgi:hypothetical protein